MDGGGSACCGGLNTEPEVLLLSAEIFMRGVEVVRTGRCWTVEKKRHRGALHYGVGQTDEEQGTRGEKLRVYQ